MPNLYIAIANLQELEVSSDLSQEQKDFIKYLLSVDGNALQNFTESRYLSTKTLKHIASLLKQEIEKIEKECSIYLSALKNLKNAIHGMESRPFIDEDRQKRKDIFSRTMAAYKGIILLPIIQKLDFRVGDALGVCNGYVLKWIECLLNGTKPFGVDPEGEPPFDTKIYASFSHRYPELNHLAVLTPEISALQDNGMKMKLSPNVQVDVRYKDTRSDRRICDLAEHLLCLADAQKSKTIYRIEIDTWRGGHALGFYWASDEKLHFIDANAGWFRFDDVDDFANWLPFYFKILYEGRINNNYSICAYAMQKEEKSSLPESKVASATMFIPVKQVRDDVGLAQLKRDIKREIILDMLREAAPSSGCARVARFFSNERRKNRRELKPATAMPVKDDMETLRKKRR